MRIGHGWLGNERKEPENDDGGGDGGRMRKNFSKLKVGTKAGRRKLTPRVSSHFGLHSPVFSSFFIHPHYILFLCSSPILLFPVLPTNHLRAPPCRSLSPSQSRCASSPPWHKRHLTTWRGRDGRPSQGPDSLCAGGRLHFHDPQRHLSPR